jgi:hypothetical protein
VVRRALRLAQRGSRAEARRQPSPPAPPPGGRGPAGNLPAAGHQRHEVGSGEPASRSALPAPLAEQLVWSRRVQPDLVPWSASGSARCRVGQRDRRRPGACVQRLLQPCAAPGRVATSIVRLQYPFDVRCQGYRASLAASRGPCNDLVKAGAGSPAPALHHPSTDLRHPGYEPLPVPRSDAALRYS